MKQWTDEPVTSGFLNPDQNQEFVIVPQTVWPH